MKSFIFSVSDNFSCSIRDKNSAMTSCYKNFLITFGKFGDLVNISISKNANT